MSAVPADPPRIERPALYDGEGRPLGPGGRPFTAEQAEAIIRRDGPLLLAANAGSGKTTVLAERFVRLCVEDGIAPARILAITFTERAAGELRARIRGRLAELGERALARDLEAAWVSTIHGFCARVLRTHALAAGLDPAFRVLDEAEARALRAAAFERALAGFLDESANGARTAALDLVAAYGAARLERLVGELHDLLRSRGQTAPGLPAAPAPADVAPLARELVEAARGALAHLAAAGDGAMVARARAAIERCVDALQAGGEPCAAALESGVFKAGNTRVLREEPCTRYLTAIEALGAACRDREAVAALTLAGELLGRFAAAYAAGKRAEAAVDYDDLELHVRDLLAATPALAAAYAERFERVMVDEFQDTNPLQLELLRLIDRNQTFVVGDEHQSIYGFRHADVEVFRGERRRLQATGATATLAANFRSEPEILDTLNAAFAPRFGASFTPLRPRPDAPPAEGRALVELLLTDAPAWDDDDAPDVSAGLPAAARWRHAEARLVAQRVADLVRVEGFSARDVVVLVRAATDMVVFERAIEAHGLATLASSGRGYWARQPVADLCAYLAVLANPRDETALFGLLASPLVGLSADGLALVGAAAPPGGRADALERAVAEPAMSAADAAKLRDLRAWLQAERAAAPRLGLDELLARAVARTGYDLHVLGLPGGRRRLANVLKLQRLAAAFEARRGRDVRGFIDHANAELEARSREADAPVELGDADAVRLMTIHAAKGLEFPVVVVADTGREGGGQAPDVLVDGSRVGLRLVTLDGLRADALEQAALKEELRAREAAEDERVFYVAMTRAEQRLIVSGACSLATWPQPRAGGMPLSWIGPALVPDLPARAAGGIVDEVVSHEAGGFPATVRVVRNAPDTLGAVLREPVPAHRAVAAAARPEPTAGEAGEQLALELDGAPEAPPPQARAGVLAPGTLSYSSLSEYGACAYRWYARRVLRLPEVEPPSEAAAGEHAASGLERRLRGTLVHELLEDLDFAAPAAPGADAVRALAASHEAEISDEQVVDVIGLVAAFTDGPLVRRLAVARRVRRERTFSFPLGDEPSDPLVNGVIDVLAIDADGTALVLDYKSDDVSPEADLEALVEGSYGIQRRIYALAALRSGAPRAEVVHVYLQRAGEPVVARFDAGDAPRLEAEVRAAARGLLAGEFPVTDLPHRGLCATCPARRTLCRHDESLTLRELPAA